MKMKKQMQINKNVQYITLKTVNYKLYKLLAVDELHIFLRSYLIRENKYLRMDRVFSNFVE